MPIDRAAGDTPRQQLLVELARQALINVLAGEIPVSGETFSMRPLLRGGDILTWRRPEAPLRCGDLVIYLQPAGLIVHRALAEPRHGILRTKGDGRPTADVEPVDARFVPEGDVVGVATALRRGPVELSLEGPRPRTYAAVAWLISWTGDGVYRVVARGDAVLGRVLQRQDAPLALRRVAWWLQRMTQTVLWLALFRVCHPRVVKEGS